MTTILKRVISAGQESIRLNVLGSIGSILLGLEEGQNLRVDDARIRIINGTVAANEQLRALAGGKLEVKLAAELDE